MSHVISALVTGALLAALVWFIVKSPAVWAKRVWTITFAIVVGGGVSMMAAHSFLAKWGFRGDNARTGLLRMMDGSAHRPYVYRRLAPDIVAIATDAVVPRLPPKTIDYLVEHSPLIRYRVDELDGFGIESWNLRKAVAFHVAYALVWLSLFGTLLASAALLHATRVSSWIQALATASLAIALVPLIFVGGGYLYDPTELFLWTALLVVAVRRWLFCVPVLFTLMLVNKESALLAIPALLPILAHASGGLSTKKGRVAAMIWAACLGVIGLCWLGFVRGRFASSPGEPREMWLFANLAFWTRPTSFFKFAPLFSPALPSPRGANVLLLLLLFVPIRFGWKLVQRDIRWSTLILALLLAPLYLVNGYLDEIRALSLLFPLLYLIAVEGIHAMLRSEEVTRSRY
jgi:hypothetical protein